MEKKLFQSFLIFLCVFSSLYFISNGFMISFVFIMIPFLILLSIRYCFLCINSLPAVSFKNFWFMLGLFLIISAPLFDTSITLIKNPDLSREGNMFVVALLKHNVTLSVVIALFMIYQLMLVVLSALYWVLAYKSAPRIIQDLKKYNTYQKILKIHGMKKLTIRQFFIPIEEPFYANALLGVTMISICVCHIYCGLEWLELVPTKGYVFLLIPIFLFDFIYVIYLLYHSKQSDDSSNDLLANVRES